MSLGLGYLPNTFLYHGHWAWNWEIFRELVNQPVGKKSRTFVKCVFSGKASMNISTFVTIAYLRMSWSCQARNLLWWSKSCQEICDFQRQGIWKGLECHAWHLQTGRKIKCKILLTHLWTVNTSSNSSNTKRDKFFQLFLWILQTIVL